MAAPFWQRLRQRWTRSYRVSLIDDETLYEKRQFLIKPITILIATVLLVLLLVGGTSLAIFYTPQVREYIPGCIDPNLQAQQSQIVADLNRLERLQVYQDSMLEVFRAMVPEGDNSLAGTQFDADEAPINPRPAAQAPAPPKRATAENSAVPRVMVRKSSPGTALALLNFYPPLRGTPSRKFDREESHFGIDIVPAGNDKMVRAATDGFVVLAEFSDKNGHVLGILGPDNVLTYYKHNRRLTKTVGSSVVAGEVIAEAGDTGENSSGTHLHFEVWQNGYPLDPLELYHNFD